MGHDASFLLWEEGGDYSDHHRPSFAPQPRTSLRAALPQPIALSRAATNISALSPGSGIGTEFCPAMLLVAASKSLFFACRKAPSPPSPPTRRTLVPDSQSQSNMGGLPSDGLGPAHANVSPGHCGKPGVQGRCSDSAMRGDATGPAAH